MIKHTIEQAPEQPANKHALMINIESGTIVERLESGLYRFLCDKNGKPLGGHETHAAIHEKYEIFRGRLIMENV